MALPAYMINPHAAFPEVPSKVQSSANVARPVSSLALYAAFLLSGCERRGILAETDDTYLAAKFESSCQELMLDPNRVMRWADSILIPPSATFPDDEALKYVPTKIKKFTLRPYQFKRAVWAAFRYGSIFALGCGLGKTITAIAAAIGAASSGRCSFKRLCIFCPANAIGVWQEHLDFLKTWFEDVHIISHDIAHKALLDTTIGGALIIDEVHKLKNEDSRRSKAMLQVRAAFEWCVCLTGTLLHAGPAGMLAVQDIAVPGGGRFFSEWAFGEAFECIVKIDTKGRGTRHKVVMPPAHKQMEFVNYMTRLVTSLSLDSPEVASCLQLPERSHITLDTYEEPDWVTELRLRKTKQFKDNRVFWIPDAVDSKMEVPMIAAYIQAVSSELDIRDKQGLPTLADPMRVQAVMSREGRFDRVVVKEWVTSEECRCYFEYAPGTNKDNPGYGPKFVELNKWFNEHPGEKLMLSAMGKSTIDMCIKYLAEKQIPHHVIRGGTPSKNRVEFVREFQEENQNIMVMVVQQEAGAEAISLTKACYSILMDHSWKPAAYTQLIHRTYRSGQERACEHIDMVFGRLQMFILQRLARGEGFDAAVRHEIEKQWRNGQGTENETNDNAILTR